VSTNITFGDPEAMLKRKAEDRCKFLELPPAEAQRRIHVQTEGLAHDTQQEDPLFTTDLTGDAILD
jgi:hypothetical protein